MPGWKAEAGSKEESVDSGEPGLRFSLPPSPLLAGSSPCRPPRAAARDPLACVRGPSRRRSSGKLWLSRMGVCGSLFLPWKCLVVVSLRLLFLVPTGVPVRSGDATFPKAMDNVTVRQGESATLR